MSEILLAETISKNLENLRIELLAAIDKRREQIRENLSGEDSDYDVEGFINLTPFIVVTSSDDGNDNGCIVSVHSINDIVEFEQSYNRTEIGFEDISNEHLINILKELEYLEEYTNEVEIN